MKPRPRETLAGTRAEGKLLASFWTEYISARVRGGTEEIVGDARAIFTIPILDQLQHYLSREALSVPVVFTEQLRNRVVAVSIGYRDKTQIVAVNARFKIDPEIIAHTLIEEYDHGQQRIDGTDFDAQRRRYEYHERPYERKAKGLATKILGYDAPEYDAILIREERENPLGDG